MTAERQPPVNFTSGVFDKPRQPRLEPRKAAKEAEPVQPTPPPAPEASRPKEDFMDVFTQQQKMASETADKLRGATSTGPIDENAINRLNKALEMNATGPTVDDEVITPEEMELAEQMIFKGYAEINVEMKAFPGKKFTICSTSAEDLSMMDEILYDMVKAAKSDIGDDVDLPENHVITMRNAIYIALSYRGIDGKDIAPDNMFSLNSIKRAINKLSELLGEGDMENAKTLKASLKKAVIKRATLVKRMSTPFIDFLSGEKVRFDNKMSRIMSMKTIVPKS